MVGRGHVQTHNVSELLDKFRITRDLEGLDQMWLQPLCAPMARYARLADAQHLGHAARAPLGRLRGRSLRAASADQARRIGLPCAQAQRGKSRSIPGKYRTADIALTASARLGHGPRPSSGAGSDRYVPHSGLASDSTMRARGAPVRTVEARSASLNRRFTTPAASN